MPGLLKVVCPKLCVYVFASKSAHPQEQANFRMQKIGFHLIKKAVYVRLSFLQIISVVVNESGVS